MSDKVRSRTSTFLHRFADDIENSQILGVFRDILLALGQFLKNVFRRMMIWVLSLLVAFFIPLHDVGVPFFMQNWTTEVIRQGKVKDVFFGVVAMVILSATDILDGIISRRKKNIDIVTLGCCWVLLLIYFCFLFYGMSTYSGNQASGAPQWAIFGGMLGISALGELLIAKCSD